ncbi:hypothetical protein KEM54_006851 [Ascosphaera aggregata]|nr:hypothetical protein KEM54_006851 [Ascosphaera aggregata]
MDPVQEARTLVQALNAPGNSADAPKIQERLLNLQRSEAGWSIANGLLRSDDSTERFFGALTLTIRIHQDWESLKEDDQHALLDSGSVTGANDTGPRFEARNRLNSNINDAIHLVEYTLNAVLSTTEGADSSNASEKEEQLLDSAKEAIKSLNAGSTVPAALFAMAQQLTWVMEAVAPSAMEMLTDVLTHQSPLVDDDQLLGILNFLSGPLGERYAIALLRGDYEKEAMQFLELLMAHASIDSLHLLTEQPTLQTERIIFLLHTLFRVPGFPEIDEKVSTLLLEFWTNAADDMSDVLMEGELNVVPNKFKMELAQAMQDCYHKLCYPNASTFQRWDEDERRNFSGFRRDFADFLLIAYSLLGNGLVQQFQERALVALNAKNWDDFEVSAFCLASLSDAVADLENMDPAFHTIFLSPGFEDICFNRTPLPKRSRQTLADMIARYTPYFERNEITIPRTLNFLFNSLELPSCDRIASKSISTLCQNCRKALVVYVQEFINNFNALRSNPSVSYMTLERVAEGIAAVIKAISSDSEKVNRLMSLLEPFEQLAEQARQQWQQGQSEEALASAIKAIRCTASIGKGYRDQSDVIVELDDDEDMAYAAAFWSPDGAGGSPQACIVRILKTLVRTFSFDGEIIEATCDVLRAGYTEDHPGPYVLSPQVTVDFVKTAAVVSSPRFPVVMATATSFLASHALHHTQVAFGATEFILHIYELILYMSNSPDLYDPEVAHSCIDLLDHLLRKMPGVFYNLVEARADGFAILGVILEFTIKALKGPDPLPLRSASSFWTALFNLPDPPPVFQPSQPTRSEGYANSTPTMFDQCLATLSAVLIYQISGNCARSDLERLSEIIKKFIFKHQGAAKYHLGKALAVMDAENTRRGQGSHLALVTSGEQAGARKGPSKADQERFLSVLIASRGSRVTLAEVKAYWITCRGSGFAYA